MNELSKKRRMAKMKSLRDVALEYSDYARCEDCKIRDLCNNSSVFINCSWMFLAGVATGRIYRTGRLRKVKNYPMDACNKLLNHIFTFRRKYVSKCYECPIFNECKQLAFRYHSYFRHHSSFHCYFSFLLCVIFGIIDVNGERKEQQK